MRGQGIRAVVLWIARWVVRFIQWSGDVLHAKEISAWIWERYGHLIYRGFAPAWLTTVGLAAAGVVPVIVLILIAIGAAYWLGLQIDRNEKLMAANREWLEATEERIQQQVRRLLDAEQRLVDVENVALVAELLKEDLERRRQAQGSEEPA